MANRALRVGACSSWSVACWPIQGEHRHSDRGQRRRVGNAASPKLAATKPGHVPVQGNIKVTH